MSSKMLKESEKKTKSALNLKGIFWVAFITIIVVIFVSSIKIKDHTLGRCLVLGDECIGLEVVKSVTETTKGLSGRDNLSGGMLFAYDEPSRQCIWMRDMKFNIDIIWLDQNKKVTKVMSDVSPSTFPNSFCSDNTKYVIELNSGVIKNKSLKVGQQLDF